MKNRRVVYVVLVLALAVVLLSGCTAASRSATIDPEAPPQGVWQALVVFPLTKALMFLADVIGKAGIPFSYGWAIILFTIIIKLVTLPLSLSQMRSARAMQALQPQLQALQKKYAKDRETLTQKQMALYKEAGVNPAGGCFPLLIQFPILIGLYNALYRLAGIGELVGERFFWIPDLSFPGADIGTSWLSKAWQAKDWAQLATYLVLPLLLVVTQIIMQKMTQASTPTTGEQQQGMMNQMFMVMSVMFGWITLGVPSGLALYWVVSNLLQMVQQYVLVSRFAKAPVTLVLPKDEPETKESKEAPEFDVDESDLVLIKGIGGKTAAALAEAGIVSFADLAAADAEQLNQIMVDANLGVGQRDYESWIRQAAKLERESSQQQENPKG
jgi:YidC/Oxa1 family membrane protein insertase